jgi:hypothetical protein
MAFRLNHLFQTAPEAVLARTVIFMDGINPALMRNKLTHLIDLEPVGKHARARVLSGMHQYEQDSPLQSYYVVPGVVTVVPREDPPYRFVFLPEFTRCRLLISVDGDAGQYLRLDLEENLNGTMPPPEAKFIDSFAYWDHTNGPLLGIVRGTAILYKQPDKPWTITMQQIVGIPGDELVRTTFTRVLQV